VRSAQEIKGVYMKKVFVLVILALVVGGVFAQTNNSTYMYTWEEYQGREETPSGIRYKGQRYPTTHNQYRTSNGVYEYYDCYLVGSFGFKGGDPAQNGPLIDKKGVRSYPDFRRGSIRLDWGKYPIIHTGPVQTVAIMTSQEINFWRDLDFSENVRLLLIQPNTRVEFNEDGLILISGTITEDKNIKRASSLDEVMSTYSQVMDYPNLYGMNLAYNAAKVKVGDDPDDIANAIISGYATGQFGYSLASGIVMPIWMIPAEFANAFGQNILKAALAYAVAMAYGTAPKSSDELKYDLYVLLAGQDVGELLKSSLKAAGVSIGTEVLSKEVVLKKLAEAGKAGSFQTMIMKTNVAQAIAKKLSLTGIAKAVPIISAAIFSIKDAVDVISFGNEAKRYYTNKVAEGEKDLPENVNVVFQTASFLGVSKDGFFVPANSNPKNNTGIQLGNIGSDNSTHRIFQLEHVGDGWYRIKNNKFGVLTVPGSKNEDDVQMVLSPQGNNNPTNQQFKITKAGTGLYQIWTYYGRLIRVRKGLVRRNHIVTWAESRFDVGSQTWRIYTVDAQGKLTQLGGIDSNHDFTQPTPGPAPAPAPAPAPTTGPANWTAVSDSTFGTNNNYNTINGVAFGNNTWVAVGRGKIAYSSDNGRSWTAVTFTPASSNPFYGVYNIYAVAFGAGTFVAVGSGGRMATSPDGKTWTGLAPGSSKDPGQSTFGTTPISGIAYGNGRWVAVGNNGKMAFSTNGTDWTAVSNSTFDTNHIIAVAFGNNMFIAVSSSGNRMASSPDGRTWTAVANSPFAVQSIAWGNNKWVVGGGNGRLAHSTNGTVWTAIPSANNPLSAPAGGGLNVTNGIAFGNGRFVAAGPAHAKIGRIAYSTDGENWTAVANTPFTGYRDVITAVAYGSGRFVAVGYNGKMAYADW
jgi:hypothetical protein